MPYRMGLARGDIPRGGFFGNLVRGVVGTVGGAIGGFIKGGPVGGIVGAVGGSVTAIKANINASHPTDQVGGTDAGTPKGQDPASLVRLHQLNVHKAHAGGKQIGAGQMQHALPGGTQMGVTADGSMVAMHRRHRRIRWTNTRALGRAERRIHMAVKHMRRYIKWVSPHKKGKAVPHFGRKRK